MFRVAEWRRYIKNLAECSRKYISYIFCSKLSQLVRLVREIPRRTILDSGCPEKRFGQIFVHWSKANIQLYQELKAVDSGNQL